MAENRVLIVGGGFSGLTAAVEAAEAGSDVIIVEKNPYLGGRVTQLNKYFWKMCPPNCGLEIQYKRIKNNGQVKIYTLAEVEKISGTEGNFDVTIKIQPRFVNDKCTGCNKCAEACEIERPNDFDFGMSKTKAAYLPHNQAFPLQYVIDEKTCKGPSCNKCAEACKYDAIHLDMKPETVNVKVGAVVMATGWNPYDATKMDNLGFGKVQNVIMNMMMERLAAPDGPTAGRSPSLGRQRGEEHRLCAMRGLPRRKPSGPLFLYLLPGVHQAGDLRPGTLSRFQGQDLLYRHADLRSLRKPVLHQDQGR